MVVVVSQRFECFLTNHGVSKVDKRGWVSIFSEMDSIHEVLLLFLLR